MIRLIMERDAEPFLELCKKIDGETGFMLFEDGERSTTIEQQRNIIKKISHSSNSAIFVDEIENKLVGYLMAIGGNPKRIRHSVYIVAGVANEASGKGIGTQLFKALENWAKTIGVIRLELTVRVNNTSAISLYEKLGYEIEGIKRASCIIDGSLVDSYYMSKILKCT
ncbi:GNAT family N-acetyltransferase [Bacillus mycoides]|uniref:GNAT family N-acetyltransferase n=1 Tax=Bacillus mycoides TaxID=1405 RepID=UPI001C0177E8|nr:GNAT family N-acetyltransferase [Bacillus mycoides]QWG36910.1 GNAT family N-acetyltransferase [Bacillus mycoides]QWI41082.1 GNAT family N-acetyltransferase [Bacillus mycoides]